MISPSKIFATSCARSKKWAPSSRSWACCPRSAPSPISPRIPIDEKRLGSVEAIINSMTAKERENHNLIDGKRRKRIALGSGTSVQEVNQVLKQYQDMKKMMKQYGAMAKTKMRGLGKFAGLKGS